MRVEIFSEFVIPISFGSTEVIETGKWGFQKPQTVLMTAPCREACPAGINIPEFLYLCTEGKEDEALQAILKENPLPGVCGRVCTHPCEMSCNRGHYDEPVSIRGVERYISDRKPSEDVGIQPIPNQNPKRIAVVGAGPAGLSCAYFASMLGHRVTVYEAEDEVGGVLRWGIPEYRLPKRVLRRELNRILRLPIEIRTGVRLGRDLSIDELDSFDAIFLSPGAGVNVSLSIQGEKRKRIWTGGEFLRRINSKEMVKLGKETLVIGGGNTAMDVARSALRLGSHVKVAYRRTREEMPAIEEEIKEAEEEGVQFRFLIQPVKIDFTKKRRVAVTFQRMRLRGLDRDGRGKPSPIRGDFMTLEADDLITAIGEQVDLSGIPREMVKKGLIEPDSSSKFFAGGDATAQPRTVVAAVASGKKAAISMDLFLRGEDPHEHLSRIRVGEKGSLSMEAYLRFRETGEYPEVREVVPFSEINTLYFKPRKGVRMRRRGREKALKGFSEVNLGFNPKEARFSASRCFFCGTCNDCLNCYFFCPEGVVSFDREGTRRVDFVHCKGCGTCARACPRHVIRMVGIGGRV